MVMVTCVDEKTGHSTLLRVLDTWFGYRKRGRNSDRNCDIECIFECVCVSVGAKSQFSI